MRPRYDPTRAYREAFEPLVGAAIHAFIADGDTGKYVAAFRAAEQQADRAADAERARGKNWRDLRDAVLRDDRCHYCGEGATQVDHVVPFSRGGTDTLDNLVPACESCNTEKLDFTVDEWRAYRLERGECWPPEGFNARLRRIVSDVMHL